MQRSRRVSREDLPQMEGPQSKRRKPTAYGGAAE